MTTRLTSLLLGHRGSSAGRSKVPRDSRSRPRRLGLESLEERRLLSVVTAAVNSRQLVVTGTEKGDTIDVRQVGSNLQVEYSTFDAGTLIGSGTLKFPASTVDKITVNGGLGADTLSFVDPATPSRFVVKLDGGSGFDPTVHDMLYAKNGVTATGGWVVRVGNGPYTRYSTELLRQFLDQYGFVVDLNKSIYSDPQNGWDGTFGPGMVPTGLICDNNAGIPYADPYRKDPSQANFLQNQGLDNVHGLTAEAAAGFALMGEAANAGRLLQAINQFGFDKDGTPIRHPEAVNPHSGCVTVRADYPKDDMVYVLGAAHSVYKKFGVNSDAGKIAKSLVGKYVTAIRNNNSKMSTSQRISLGTLMTPINGLGFPLSVLTLRNTTSEIAGRSTLFKTHVSALVDVATELGISGVGSLLPRNFNRKAAFSQSYLFLKSITVQGDSGQDYYNLPYNLFAHWIEEDVHPSEAKSLASAKSSLYDAAKRHRNGLLAWLANRMTTPFDLGSPVDWINAWPEKFNAVPTMIGVPKAEQETLFAAVQDRGKYAQRDYLFLRGLYQWKPGGTTAATTRTTPAASLPASDQPNAQGASAQWRSAAAVIGEWGAADGNSSQSSGIFSKRTTTLAEILPICEGAPI